MILEDMLADIHERGLKLLLRGDGTPFLRGDKAQATPLLIQVLQLHRPEIVAYLQGQAVSSVAEPSPVEEPVGPVGSGTGNVCREWAWRDGRRRCEAPGDEHFGDRQWHPDGAWWWRIQEASEWHLVPQPEKSA